MPYIMTRPIGSLCQPCKCQIPTWFVDLKYNVLVPTCPCKLLAPLLLSSGHNFHLRAHIHGLYFERNDATHIEYIPAMKNGAIGCTILRVSSLHLKGSARA